jgi:type IV secretory pathway TrbD component
MLVIVFVAARWIVRRLAVPSALWSRLCMGCFVLGLLLLAEFSLVPWLRGLSIREYLAGRDPRLRQSTISRLEYSLSCRFL